MGVEMKKLLIAMGILLMLFAFASCNNDNQSLDDEVAATVAEELKPRELVEKVLRDGDKEGLDISYDLREVEKGAKPSYTHTLSVTIVFSGYEYSRVLTIESGRLTYTFYGTMAGSRFTSRAYELRTEEAMAVSGTSEGTVDVELSIDAREGASGTSYGVTLTTDEEGKTVLSGSYQSHIHAFDSHIPFSSAPLYQRDGCAPQHGKQPLGSGGGICIFYDFRSCPFQTLQRQEQL